MAKVIFKYATEDRIYPLLLDRLNKLVQAYNKDLIVTSGFRSIESQKAIAANLIKTHKDYYLKDNGAVYNAKGQCMAAAYGNSNHCWGLAVDVDGWAKELTNTQLAKFGLRKPMDYEPWHIESTDIRNLSLEQKKQLFYAYMRAVYPMDIKTFQMITGLASDGIVGTKTIAKAQEIKEVISKIIAKGEDVKTGEQAVKWLVDNKVIAAGDYWLKQIKEVPYLDELLVKMVNEFRG